MIFMQMVLLKECLKYSNISKKKEIIHDKDHQINPYIYKPINLFDFKYFWNWPYLIDYAYFLILFSLSVGFISQLVGFENCIYVEVLGGASASVEAIIGIPQIIKNYSTKNTDSLSSFMIYTWVIGDSIKSFYFFKTSSPIQLLSCGIFQLSTDLIILFQIIYYHRMKENVQLADKYAVCKLKIGNDDKERPNFSTEGEHNEEFGPVF
jgi:uncharacterized protein with PQ loop repeat